MTTNPYKRLRELTATSQKNFAERYGMSKTTMINIECGQLVDLSDRMIVSLGQECHEQGVNAKQVLTDEYNAQSLQDAYHAWQSTERMSNAHLFQAPLTGNETFEKSPFSVFIEDVAGTRQKFCKLLKVPSASVMWYANGDTLTMPKAIEEALTQVRFPWMVELKDLQTKWVGVGMVQ